jgi:hypothetical protein
MPFWPLGWKMMGNVLIGRGFSEAAAVGSKISLDGSIQIENGYILPPVATRAARADPI